MNHDAMWAVLAEVGDERSRQDAKWGEQNHPDGTGDYDGRGYHRRWRADRAKDRTYDAAKDGTLTFKHILAEEVVEALAEDDPVRLRAELVQVAAVAVAWIEKIDREMRNEQ